MIRAILALLFLYLRWGTLTAIRKLAPYSRNPELARMGGTR
jgi:hypothetical protein